MVYWDFTVYRSESLKDGRATRAITCQPAHDLAGDVVGMMGDEYLIDYDYRDGF